MMESTSLVLRTLYTRDDSVKFFYSVSSEPNYDFLSFKLNGSGNCLKSRVKFHGPRLAFPCSAGLNKMEWAYKKDSLSASNGF